MYVKGVRIDLKLIAYEEDINEMCVNITLLDQIDQTGGEAGGKLFY